MPSAGTILRMKDGGASNKKKSVSVKNQIRSITRLLKRDGFLTGELRMLKEKELKELQEKLGAKEVVEKEKKVAKKYRVVKFYERVKLIRKLKSVRAKVVEDESLKKEEKKILTQLKYIFLYPKGMKYISLFPKKEVNQQTQDKQKELLKKAKKQMKHADTELLDQFEAYCTATQINTFRAVPIAGQTEVVEESDAFFES